MNAGRSGAAPCASPKLGRIVLGVGLLAVAVRVLKGGARRRRAAWRAAFERYASQPVAIDQATGPYAGAGWGGPIHRVPLS